MNFREVALTQRERGDPWVATTRQYCWCAHRRNHRGKVKATLLKCRSRYRCGCGCLCWLTLTLLRGRVVCCCVCITSLCDLHRCLCFCHRPPAKPDVCVCVWSLAVRTIALHRPRLTSPAEPESNGERGEDEMLRGKPFVREAQAGQQRWTSRELAGRTSIGQIDEEIPFCLPPSTIGTGNWERE